MALPGPPAGPPGPWPGGNGHGGPPTALLPPAPAGAQALASPPASPPVAAPPASPLPAKPLAPPQAPAGRVGPLASGAVRLRGARSELRRQLREQQRVRTIAMGVVVLLLLGAPMLYFGIVFATRDPVLNSLDRLQVPGWAAQAPEDRIITGSRWCLIDCRVRERTLVSEGEPTETTEVYQAALRGAGWVRWEVEGCPQVEVDGDYSCWRRDEYTLDLWVRPPDCAYDPLRLRPDLDEEAEEPAEDCTGSVVEVKMQNRVADERGLPAG